MFVIYNVSTTMQVGPTKHGHPHSLYAKPYKTAGAAARTCAKFNAAEDRKLRFDRPAEWQGPGSYGWCHVDHYRTNVVRMVTRKNLRSGKEYQEASNTPGYCSPSSEAYWSM